MNVLCLLLLFSPAQQQDLSTKVSFSGPALRIPNLLAQLQKDTGVQLSAAPELVDDVVFVSFSDVPLSEVLSKVAEVSSCALVRGEGGYLLRRDAAQTTKEEREEVAFIKAELVKALAPTTNSLTLNWNREVIHRYGKKKAVIDQKLGRIDERTPEGIKLREEWHQVHDVGAFPRAVARVLKDVSLEDFARLPVGWRIVYSTHPTKMQRPLGAGGRDALAKIKREQAVWGAALHDMEEQPEHGYYITDLSGDFGSEILSSWDVPVAIKGEPERLQLILVHEWGHYDLYLRAFDKDGLRLFNYRNELGWIGYPGVGGEAQGSGGPLIQPSAATNAYMRAGSRRTYSEGEKPPTADEVAAARKLLRPYVLEAETYDPLALTATDGMRTLATAKKKPIAIWLPDSLFEAAEYALHEPVTLGSFIAQARAGADMVIDEAGTWIVGKSLMPSAARRQRASRSALARFARASDAAGYAVFDEYATLVSASGELPYYHFAPSYAQTLLPSENWAGSGGNPGFLELYGSLTSSQRATLRSGSTLTYGALSSRSKELARRAFYGAPSRNVHIVYRGGVTNVDSETTTLWPAGISPEARFALRVKTQTTTQWIHPDNGFPFYSANVDGPLQQSWSGPGPFIPKDGLARVLFTSRSLTSMDFSFEPVPGRIYTVNFSDGQGSPLVEKQPFEKLPAELQKKLQPHLDNFKTMWLKRS